MVYDISFCNLFFCSFMGMISLVNFKFKYVKNFSYTQK